MSSNPIQFQYGISLPKFLKCFGNVVTCADVLRRARWPEGFCCPRCGGSTHCVLCGQTRQRFQCIACHHQTTLIAGTLLASTKLPLTTWFLAIYLISQAKTGLSALALKHQVGVNCPTVWVTHHNIMTAMARRDSMHQLSGAVQVDNAHLGGERTGGKLRRGSENTIAFVAAVSLDAKGHPLYTKLSRVSGFTSEAIANWAKRSLRPGSNVLRDGQGCFAAVTAAGCTHRAEVVGQRKPRDPPQLKSVNTMPGNLKTMLSGAYKASSTASTATTTSAPSLIDLTDDSTWPTWLCGSPSTYAAHQLPRNGSFGKRHFLSHQETSTQT